MEISKGALKSTVHYFKKGDNVRSYRQMFTTMSQCRAKSEGEKYCCYNYYELTANSQH